MHFYYLFFVIKFVNFNRYCNLDYNDAYMETCAVSTPHTQAIDMLLFGIGRYLNLSSSRGNVSLPSNLQGIWSDPQPR